MKHIQQIYFTLQLSLLLSSINAQVTSVDYQLKYNNSSDVYECYLIINEGLALNPFQRNQGNSTFSIVTPTGSNLNIEESFMPMKDNVDYTGTEPCEWLIGNSVISPNTIPESDLYSIYPSTIMAWYNDLYPNDSIKLFSFSLSNITDCSIPAKIYENVENSPLCDFCPDYSNGFKLPLTQVYNDNLPPENIPTTLPVPVVTITGDTEININETTSLSPTTGGTWTSDNPSIASIDDLGIVTGISPGQATFTFTDNNSGCSTTSDTVTVLSPDSTFDIDKNSDFIISPNPINQQLNITSINTKNKPIAITIYNINGSKVFNSQQILKEGKHEISIDFDAYPKGLYLLHMLSENGNESLKFVKE